MSGTEPLCLQKTHVDVQRQVRKAARALGRHGFTHAYGHCSQRLDEAHFLVCAAKPLSMIGPTDVGRVVPVRGPLPDGVLGEVRIHQQIYACRPDVGGVIRAMPPKLMTLSVMNQVPRMVHGMSAYFYKGVSLWNDPQLIRNDDCAARVADCLGERAALLMRGNGSVVVGESLSDALVLNWYLEDAARIELACLAAGKEPVLLTVEEARSRATRSGRIFERMWDYLTHGDEE